MTTNKANDANVYICGVSYDALNGNGKGAAKATRVIRELSGLIPPCDMEGKDIREIKLFDVGDFSFEDVNQLMTRLQFEFLDKDGFHIILGGDHSIAIASERAFYCKCLKENKEPVIIHLDAHPDILDYHEHTVNARISPIARALEYGYEDKNITLVGIRSNEIEEMETLKKHPMIDVFKTIDIKKLGIENLVRYLANKYSDKKYLVYLSYDIDINDPGFAPGTAYPVPFGLSNFETLGIVCGLVNSLNIDTMDLVEISPSLDMNNITSWLGVKTIYEVFSTLIKSGKLKK